MDNWQDNLPREVMDSSWSTTEGLPPEVILGVTHFIQRANILNLFFFPNNSK